MKQIKIAELKDHLSEHLRAVERGLEMEVTYRTRPIVRLVPVSPPAAAPRDSGAFGRAPSARPIPPVMSNRQLIRPVMRAYFRRAPRAIYFLSRLAADRDITGSIGRSHVGSDWSQDAPWTSRTTRIPLMAEDRQLDCSAGESAVARTCRQAISHSAKASLSFRFLRLPSDSNPGGPAPKPSHRRECASPWWDT